MRKYQFLDVTGHRFGRYIAIARVESDRHGNTMWSVRCDCGTTKTVQLGALRSGVVKSCGCHKAEAARTHGLSKHPLYFTWRHMIERCTKPENPAFINYGGRGINVCERWMSVENFINDMPQKPSKTSELDRINNDGPYSPENCRWATPAQQSNNRRSNSVLVFDGRSQTLQEWARELGMDRRTISARLRKGWTVERALKTPVL